VRDQGAIVVSDGSENGCDQLRVGRQRDELSCAGADGVAAPLALTPQATTGMDFRPRWPDQAAMSSS
jgi:hypothetical protein